MENVKYEQDKKILDNEDRKILKDYDNNYTDGVVIVKRKESTTTQFKKVKVYIDGMLITISDIFLQALLDSGQFVIVGKRP